MGDTAQTTTTRMYASIRDQLASEITAGVYPAGALLPSIVYSSRRGSGWRQGMVSTACPLKARWRAADHVLADGRE